MMISKGEIESENGSHTKIIRQSFSGVVRNPFLTTLTSLMIRQEKIPAGAFEITRQPVRYVTALTGCLPGSGRTFCSLGQKLNLWLFNDAGTLHRGLQFQGSIKLLSFLQTAPFK